MRHKTTDKRRKRIPYVRMTGGALGILQNPITKENPFLFPQIGKPSPRGSKYFRNRFFN